MLITFFFLFFFNFEIIETVSAQSDVTERNVVNEAEQVHENNKKSQNDNSEQSLEQQNESPRNHKTEDAANSGNDMRPGDTKERSEEKNNEGIDGPNTGTMQMMFCLEKQNLAEKSLHSEINISVFLFILVDQPVDGEAPSAPVG